MNLLFMILSGHDSVGLLRLHTLALTALFRGARFRPVLLLCALLLCAGASAQSQSDSPVGPVWDCLLSGKRNGIAYLSFSTTNNGTLSGYEILVPQPIVAPRTSLISDALGNNGLGLRPPTTNNPSINIFGFFPVQGSWGFDNKGRITGHFLEVVHSSDCKNTVVPISTNTFASAVPINEVSATNLFTRIFSVTQSIYTNATPATYVNQQIWYAIQADCPGTLTNVVNFTAKAVTGKRLALNAKTSMGSVTMSGVPSSHTLSSLSGAWYGFKSQNQTTSFEFFDLAATAINPNIYWMSGSGADYTYSGIAMLSSQKKIALALSVLNLDGTYRSTRSVAGSFNPKKLTGNTSGLDTPGGVAVATNRVNFQVTKRLSLP